MYTDVRQSALVKTWHFSVNLFKNNELTVKNRWWFKFFYYYCKTKCVAVNEFTFRLFI